MKNHFEEAFLKQRSIGAVKAKASEKPQAPCFLMARCCSAPQHAVEWREEGALQSFGGVQTMTAQLCRRVVARVATWVLCVVDVSSLSHPTVLVNGSPTSVVDLVLSPGDIVEVPAHSSAADMWRIEWGPSFAQDVSLEAAVPTVVSLSPFVVGEAAANRNVLETMQSKVSMLGEQLQRVVKAAGASKAIAPFEPSPVDGPQLLLLHNLDWMLTALQGVEAKLESKPKRADRESQTLPHASSRAWLNAADGFASGHSPLNAPTPAVRQGHSSSIDASDTNCILNTQLVSVAHNLWVAREQLSVYAQAGGTTAEYLERLLHCNAELERRLQQRHHHVSEMEHELRRLRAATAPDRTRRHTAVQALKEILSARPPTGASDSEPLPLHAEIRLWTAVAEVLEYVEKLEHAHEASSLQLQEYVRVAEQRTSASLAEQRNIELREELSALRAQGSVEAVAALQAALGSLAEQLGGAGRSRMSAWL